MLMPHSLTIPTTVAIQKLQNLFIRLYVVHITPLVITSLRGRHTDTYKQTDKAILRMHGLKRVIIVTNGAKVCLLVKLVSYAIATKKFQPLCIH